LILAVLGGGAYYLKRKYGNKDKYSTSTSPPNNNNQPRENGNETDGNQQTGGVSQTLYNFFKRNPSAVDIQPGSKSRRQSITARAPPIETA
jgi:hypothetical protein